MYYISVHVELEPEKYAQVCHVYTKIFENLIAPPHKGYTQ